MALYDIETEQDLGISHYGSEVAEGCGTVNLSDEEVQTLVQLIREKKTTDVDDLGIETSHPKIYKKLDDAYRNAAYKAEEYHWLWYGYKSGYFEYDSQKLMDYCKQSCGYEFQYDEEEYMDDGELDEDRLEEDEYENFQEWLDGYVYGLSDNDAINFFYEHMNANLDLDNVEYTVEIPHTIIDMAKEE